MVEAGVAGVPAMYQVREGVDNVDPYLGGSMFLVADVSLYLL